MKYVFVYDAAGDVPPEFLEKYDIHRIPIEVDFGEEAYPDGMSNRDFYAKLQTYAELPKTAMPNAYKFEQFYKDYANKPDVFVMTLLISYELSPTRLQAQMAAEALNMKNVFYEECQTTTVAQGALICELCRYIDAHPDVQPKELIDEFYRLRKKVQIVAIINDLKYLKHSGRLSSTGAVIGSMLNIKPIASVVDGKVVVIAKAIGTPKAEKFLTDRLANVDNNHLLYPIHSDNEPAAQKLAQKAREILGDKQEMLIAEVGYVVGSHVGAKCYGYTYFEKD